MTGDSIQRETLRSPYLLVRKPGGGTQRLVLGPEFGIGRAEGNDLRLNDPKVSRNHAKVVLEGDAYVLSDLGSANGVLVNGVRLTGPHLLKPGELIAVGDTELVFHEPDQETAGVNIIETSDQPLPVDSGAAPARTGRRVLIFAAAMLLVAVVSILGGMLIYTLVRDEPSSPEVVTQPSPTPVQAVSPTSQTPSGVISGTPAPTDLPRTPVKSAVTPDTAGPEIEGLLLQAEALAQRSKLDEAAIVYEELVRRAPQDVAPQVGWAWALLMDDEPGQALPHAQKAIELDPTQADAAAVLARVYIELGDRASALSWAQEAVRLDTESPEALAVLAEAYMVQGRLQEAEDTADLSLEYGSDSANAHRIRGWLYLVAEGDVAQAADELQEAAGLQPELWLRYHELGQLLSEFEDYSSAILAFQDALAIRPEAATYKAMGRAYHMLDRQEEAQSALLQAITAGSQDVESYALMAAVLASQGQCGDASAYAGQALALDASAALALEALETCAGAGAAPTVLAASSATPEASTTSAPAPESTAAGVPTTVKSAAPPSPVSGRIAFPVWNRERGKYDAYIINVDGTGRRLVIEELHQPSFSPDGKWLALNGERHEQMNLFIVRPDGSGLKEISKHLEDALPDWSFRDSRLAFSSTMHGDKQSRVYIIDEVPFEGRQQEGRPLNFGPDDVRGEAPAWTPDERIVYKGCDSTVEPARCGLFVIPSGKGAQPATQLTDRQEDTAPAVSPVPGDGRIAFMSSRDGNWEIYVMNADGSGMGRLTQDAAHDGLPVWSPDGKGLAFVSNSGGVWAVWAMNPDGSNRTKLFDMGGGGLAFEWQNEQISWAPEP